MTCTRCGHTFEQHAAKWINGQMTKGCLCCACEEYVESPGNRLASSPQNSGEKKR